MIIIELKLTWISAFCKIFGLFGFQSYTKMTVISVEIQVEITRISTFSEIMDSATFSPLFKYNPNKIDKDFNILHNLEDCPFVACVDTNRSS